MKMKKEEVDKVADVKFFLRTYTNSLHTLPDTSALSGVERGALVGGRKAERAQEEIQVCLAVPVVYTSTCVEASRILVHKVTWFRNIGLGVIRSWT